MVHDGKLSWEEFVHSCEYFLNAAALLHEEWVCKGNRESPGDYYLSYSCFRTFPDKVQSASDESLSQPLETHNNSTILNCQYDIVYSLSYGVPVLYFNMSRFDGQLLSLDEIWKLFTNSDRSESESEQLWSTLTQQDHPLLNVPFYSIHPCNTDKIMSEILKNSSFAIENYVISWLSIVGSKTGIYLCCDFGKYIQK